jgi:hypothetical protein
MNYLALNGVFTQPLAIAAAHAPTAGLGYLQSVTS